VAFYRSGEGGDGDSTFLGIEASLSFFPPEPGLIPPTRPLRRCCGNAPPPLSLLFFCKVEVGAVPVFFPPALT